jgi:hypothetical protein
MTEQPPGVVIGKTLHTEEHLREFHDSQSAGVADLDRATDPIPGEGDQSGEVDDTLPSASQP